MKTTLLGILSVTLLGACAGDPSPAPSPTTPPSPPIPMTLPESVPLEQFQSLLVNLECSQLLGCMTTGNATGFRAYLSSYAQCVAHHDALPGEASRKRYAHMVSAASIGYDAVAARRCLEALRTVPCEGTTPAVCASVFNGLVATGGSCRRREDCANDEYCNFTNAERGYVCPGACRARVGLGEQCFGDSSACSTAGATGEVTCQYDPTIAGQPYPYRCVDTGPGSASVAQLGEICTDYRGGSRVMRPCAEGLDCQSRFSMEGSYGVCSSPAAVGEACVRYCQGGAVCEFDGTRFEQRCLVFTVRDREGETCIQGNTGGEVCNVLLGLDCVAGHCRHIGTGAENSVCFTARYGVDSCNPGLYCNGATLTCQRRKADGVSCVSGEECDSRECVPAEMGPAVCGVSRGCG